MRKVGGHADGHVKYSRRGIGLDLTQLLETDDECAHGHRKPEVVDVLALVNLDEGHVDFWYRILQQMHDVLQEDLVRRSHRREDVLRDGSAHDVCDGMSERVF